MRMDFNESMMIASEVITPKNQMCLDFTTEYCKAMMNNTHIHLAWLLLGALIVLVLALAYDTEYVQGKLLMNPFYEYLPKSFLIEFAMALILLFLLAFWYHNLWLNR